jgi:hypothetical protein
MGTMQLATILLIATMSCVHAGTIETIDPNHPSKDNPDEIIRINGGPPEHVRWRTFGSDRIEQARAFGISVQNDLNRDDRIMAKGFALYPNDPFFAKCFYRFARNP